MNQCEPGVTQDRYRERCKVLFIHQNFPGQFRRIAADLAQDRAYQVVAIGKRGCPQLGGVTTLTYSLHRVPSPQTHHYARPLEAGILHGQAVLRLLQTLKSQGFVPDVVVAHPGWGESMFVKEVFPATRLIHFMEYFYHASGADAGFDPAFPSSLDDAARIRAKNALQLMNLEYCDRAISPTAWQKSLHPTAYHSKIDVLHEGIDTVLMRPDTGASFVLPDGKVLRPGDPVVTYVSRNLEPYRGFHVFMQALPQILAAHPTCDIVVAGGDEVSYGSKPRDAENWRMRMLRDVPVDPARVHFLGKIPYDRYRQLLQVSAVHVYLTYPFVLSWSMLEAMACGCLVIGSDTAPVREVIVDGKNGLLANFFNVDRIAQVASEALHYPSRFADMRLRARVTVESLYGLKQGLLGYRALLEPAGGSSMR